MFVIWIFGHFQAFMYSLTAPDNALTSCLGDGDSRLSANCYGNQRLAQTLLGPYCSKKTKFDISLV